VDKLDLILPLQKFLTLTKSEQEKVWQNALERLLKLAKVDPGFFVLGTYSLIEAWVSQHHVGDDFYPAFSGFTEKVRFHLDAFGKNHKQNYSKVLEYFLNSPALNISNRVRHEFANCDKSKFYSVFNYLKTFTLKASLASKDYISELEQKFDDLKDYYESPINELNDELQKTKNELEKTKSKLENLTSIFLELNNKEKRIQELESEISNLDTTIRTLENESHDWKEIARKRDQKIDELRNERKKYEDMVKQNYIVVKYFTTLINAHQLSRSYLEFQKSLLKLSQEQKDAMKSFEPGQSFLIRGGAGTGKTLVLLTAIKRLRNTDSSSLGFESPKNITILTYSRTLQRYSLWLLDLLEGGIPEENVQTIDAFFLNLYHQLISPNHKILYQNPQETLAPNIDKTVWEELENFVWAWGLSRQEYVDQRIPRNGRKYPLRIEQRAQVWETGEKLLTEMEIKGLFSRAAMRFCLLQKILNNNSSVKLDVIAIDEIQDVLPVELKIVGKISNSVLMAGDSSQSIYNAGFSFSQAGINLKGRSRVLKLSYRCTRPLSLLAEGFLNYIKQSNIQIPDKTDIESNRMGLPPTLKIYDSNNFSNVLKDCLDFYMTVLKYQPSSISILAPTNEALEQAKKIVAVNYPIVYVHDNPKWMEQDGIKLSTIQSAKGLDFPVVIAYLPKLPYNDQLEDSVRYIHQASLVYVAITRSLENLTVIMPQKTDSTVLKALKEAFENLTLS